MNEGTVRMFPVLLTPRSHNERLREHGCPEQVPWDLVAKHERQVTYGLFSAMSACTDDHPLTFSRAIWSFDFGVLFTTTAVVMTAWSIVGLWKRSKP